MLGSKMYLFFILAVFASVPLYGAPERLTITGSSTIAPLAAELAKAFERKVGGNKVRIDVQTGGSSRGVSDTLRERSDIGMVSRSLKPRENLNVYPVARDGIAVIVHGSNKIKSLSKQQLSSIYRGQKTNWQAFGGSDRPIVVVHKAAGRSTQELFLHFLQITNRQVKAAVIIGDNQQGLKTIAGLPGAIGYVSIGSAISASGMGEKLNMVALDEVLPTFENVSNGRYPLLRVLNFVTKGPAMGYPKQFLKFALSQEASSVVLEQSFVPIGG